MSSEIIHVLEQRGWDVVQNHEWHLGTSYVPHPVKTKSIYLFEKTYLQADNISVIVSIHPYQQEFVIIDCAEHRTTGPNITVEVAQTLAEALVLAQSSCYYWDEWLNSKSKK